MAHKLENSIDILTAMKFAKRDHFAQSLLEDLKAKGQINWHPEFEKGHRQTLSMILGRYVKWRLDNMNKI